MTLHWTLICPYLSCTATPLLNTVVQLQSQQYGMKGKDNYPPLAGNPPPSVAEDTGNLLCQKDTTLAHIQLGEH